MATGAASQDVHVPPMPPVTPGKVDTSALERFDRIEGFNGFGKAGSLFTRTLTDVDVGSGRVRRAWTYETTWQDAPVITGGDGRRGRVRRRCRRSSGHAAAANDFFSRLATL